MSENQSKISSPTKYVVAVTGSTGSGKSTACAILRELGAYVVDADCLSRRVCEPHSDVCREIRKTFGPEVFDTAGNLNREQLARLVFADAEKRRLLEHLIHPAVHQLALGEFRLALSQGYNLIIYDVPLFFEAQLDKEQWRKVVLVKAPEELCAARAFSRDGMNESEFKRRHAAQLPFALKEAKADLVVDNTGSTAELHEQMVDLLRMLSEEHPPD
ncbi:MAG TPA: dephospho-CoA kinase [Oligoflexia bacterium]|nr:dephospho-CoA kinase [Oligoflexia bacterium]